MVGAHFLSVSLRACAHAQLATLALTGWELSGCLTKTFDGENHGECLRPSAISVGLMVYARHYNPGVGSFILKETNAREVQVSPLSLHRDIGRPKRRREHMSIHAARPLCLRLAA